MKRKVLFTICVILTVLLLAGCSIADSGQNNNGAANGGNVNDDPKQINTIVFFDEELDSLIMPVRTEMMQIVMLI